MLYIFRGIKYEDLRIILNTTPEYSPKNNKIHGKFCCEVEGMILGTNKTKTLMLEFEDTLDEAFSKSKEFCEIFKKYFQLEGDINA